MDHISGRIRSSWTVLHITEQGYFMAILYYYMRAGGLVNPNEIHT